MTEPALPSWRDTETTRAIEAFVAAATRDGDPGYVPPRQGQAVDSSPTHIGFRCIVRVGG